MNILVSGIASDIGYNVGKILKNNQISNYIFGMDINNKILKNGAMAHQIYHSTKLSKK